MRDYSLSDVAAVTGHNNSNGGFGDGNSAWWIIIFLAILWGKNGFGNNGNGTNGSGGTSVTDGYVLASDFATLQRQLDGGFDRLGNRIENVNNGICEGFYAQNTNLLNGFSGVQQTLCQGFSGINQNIANANYDTTSAIKDCCCQTQQNLAQLGYNLQNCCCTIERGQDSINFNMQNGINTLQNTMCFNTRDIIDNQNANYRALHDEIVANRIEDKNAQIQMQQNEINALRLSASQQAQNNYLINQLRPVPVPAFAVSSPFYYGSCNGGCGCSNF